MNPTSPMMPMGISAARLSLDDDTMPNLSLGGHGGRKPLSLDGPTVAPAAPPMAPPGAMSQPMGGAPMQPPQPQAPPWNVQMQSDGSSVYSIPGQDGKPIILGVNPPPRLPKSLQPPTQNH